MRKTPPLPACRHTLGGVDLPPGMLWVDEFAWAAHVSQTERSITGALIVDAAPKLFGRPITLQGTENQGWISRGDLLAIQALADDPAASYPLTLADGRNYTVRFAPENPINATSVATPELPAADHPYVATLRLITVED